MCGRFTLTSPLEALRELFGFDERPNLQPRVNIAPTQDVVTLRAAEESPDGEGLVPLHLEMLRWGLAPAWAKDLSIGAKMINARSETVADRPAFRNAFASRRCLIPADGFYEWKTIAGAKQPFRIVRPDRAPFAFAGLWESWRDKQSGEEVKSCTILTTDAAGSIKDIHHRMPVIFTKKDQFNGWCNREAKAEDLQALLQPLEALEAYPVSRAVNKVSNEDLSLLEPIDLVEPPSGQENDRVAQNKPRQTSLFD